MQLDKEKIALGRVERGITSSKSDKHFDPSWRKPFFLQERSDAAESCSRKSNPEVKIDASNERERIGDSIIGPLS